MFLNIVLNLVFFSVAHISKDLCSSLLSAAAESLFVDKFSQEVVLISSFPSNTEVAAIFGADNTSKTYMVQWKNDKLRKLRRFVELGCDLMFTFPRSLFLTE